LEPAGRDGTPHAAGVGAQWRDGDVNFTSSPAARKARDLAVSPLCTSRRPESVSHSIIR